MFTSVKSGGNDSFRHGASSQTTTVIARGVKVEGEFVSQGDVLIEGEVQGSLSTSGQLTVGPEAKIVAHVSAGAGVIAGVVQGNVTIASRLEVKSTAQIFGDVRAQILSIEEGAVLQGQLAIGTERPTEQMDGESVACPVRPATLREESGL